MQVPFLDLKDQYYQLSNEIDTAIEQVLASGQYIGGRFVKEFEAEMASYHQSKYFMGCGNGSDALYLALLAAGVGAGDEVITTAYSWIATAHAISRTGATPVFVDIMGTNFQIDLDLTSQLLTDRTKAFLPVHLYGDVSGRFDEIAFAKKNNLILIEDAAQVHGLPLPIDDELSAHIICTSYYPTKQHGALGDAGGLWVNDANLSERIIRYANQGALFPDQDYHFVGINSRLDPLQAAILSAKLPYLEEWLVARIEIADQYIQALSSLDAIQLAVQSELHSFYQFVIQVPDRDVLKRYLEENGIGTGVHYSYTIPGTPPYGSRSGFPQAEKAASEVLSLPCYPGLEDEQLAYVCQTIKDHYC